MELSVSKETRDAIAQCKHNIADLKAAAQLLEALAAAKESKVTVSADKVKIAVMVSKDEAEKTLCAVMKTKVGETNALMKQYKLQASDDEQKLLKKFA